jgi:hypothetical protein
MHTFHHGRSRKKGETPEKINLVQNGSQEGFEKYILLL